MKKEIQKYLEAYSYDTLKINRLIVSAFLYSNNITKVKNKLIKSHLITDSEDDFGNLNEFLKIHKEIDFEDLIELFEFVVSPAEKIVSGAVYTPKHIRDYIVNSSFDSISVKKKPMMICDPACGCAGFLYSSAQKIKKITSISYSKIFKKYIYGLDIQFYSVQRSKLLLSLLAIYEGEDDIEFKFNIFQGNSLSFKWEDNVPNFDGFDLVLGNPPYVCSRNIENETKVLLKDWKVCSTGHPDLYIPFFELGAELLKPNGILGYITMNSFFKSGNGRALREYFSEKQYNFKIIDFAGIQIFNSKSTYTCICLIQNKKNGAIEYKKVNDIIELENKIIYNKIPYQSLDTNKGWNLNEIELLSKIESVGIPFGEKYKSRNGIATLKNNIYIFNPYKEDKKYYYLGANGEVPIEKEICNDIINPNKLIKNKTINKLLRKVIFPYYYNEKQEVKLIGEDILKNKFPYAYNYLLSKKDILAKRDKGQGKYENWYAYGRNQSLEKLKYKLFFPHITPTIPNYIINSDENLLFHNGLAIIGKNTKELKFLRKIMSSRLFWFYITNSSRLYGDNYYSLSKTYFKNFGIYDFTDAEIDYIIHENNYEVLNEYIENRYDII